MKILEIARGIPTTEYPLNGVFELDQAKALKGLGHEVVLLAIDIRSIRRKRKFGLSVLDVDGIKVYNCNFFLGRVPTKLKNFVLTRIFDKLYKKISKEFKPDIIHAHFGNMRGIIPLYAKKKYNISYAITEHESTLNSSDIEKRKKAFLKKVYSNSVVNFAVSKEFCKCLEKNFNEKFVYVPNIVSIDTFLFDKNSIRRENSFITVCNLIERKNVNAIIRGIKYLSDKGINSTLDIIGDGEQKQELILLSEELNIKDKIIFHGKQNREYSNTVFSTSSIFILTSKRETFGVSLIEGMCSGLPVIATKCGGPESFVCDKVGVLVRVNNQDELNSAMEYILKNIDKYDRQEIRNYVLDNFSPKVVAEKITKEFTNVIG